MADPVPPGSEQARRNGSQTLDTAERIGRERRCLIRDEKQADVRNGDTADGDGISRVLQRELPVVSHHGVNADTCSKSYCARATAVDEGRALGWVELDLVRTWGTTKGACVVPNEQTRWIPVSLLEDTY